MTFNIILFLKAHKLYKIPSPPKKAMCSLLAQPRKYGIQTSNDSYDESPQTKNTRITCQDHNDTAIKDKNLMAGYFPRVTCIKQESLFCSFSSTRKKLQSVQSGEKNSMWKPSQVAMRISPRNTFLCPQNILYLSKIIRMMQTYTFKKTQTARFLP